MSSWTGETGATGAVRRVPTLDWIDALIQLAITVCLMLVAGAIVEREGGGGEVAALVVAAASLALLGYRRTRARRAASPSRDESAHVHELEERLGMLEASQDRMLELEERLDFAERLLAQQRDVDRLPAERRAEA